MGMIKKAGTTTTEAPKVESGVEAAVDRLINSAATPAQAVDTTTKQPSDKAYKPRDFDAEARGKTRCVQWEAAVMSPSLAGMKWKTTEDFLRHVKRIADAGVAYTFNEKIEGI